MGRFTEKTYEGGIKEIIDSDNDYTIYYRDPYGYVAYDNKTHHEVFRMSSSGTVSYYTKDGKEIISDKKINLEDVHRDMTFTGVDGYDYSVKDDQFAQKTTQYNQENRFYTINTNDASSVIYDGFNGYADDDTTVVFDRVNGYKIKCEKYSDGSCLYEAYNEAGDSVYSIYPDGTAKISIGNGRTIKSANPMKIEDMGSEMYIVSDDGSNYSISNGFVKKIERFKEDGSLDVIFYYEQDGSFREELSDGTIYFNNNDKKLYKIVRPNGEVVVFGTKNNYALCILSPDGTCFMKDEKGNYEDKGTYYYDNDGNLVCINNNGDSFYCDYYGNVTKRVDRDGAIYTYDDEKESQIVTKNGKKSYSRISHIEYDEEAYNIILKSFNSIGESYKGAIKSACSDIENAINSFPDSYSASGISSIGSSIDGHIDLISSLAEMTNYSLLAYQTCDESLKEGLYLLIDSLFGENEINIANKFKNTIKNTIEDRDNDSILEYEESTNFKILSENAIVDSTVIDQNGNKWYLNKNKTVIGIDGKNITINYGGDTYGDTFSLTFDENGIVILKDSNGNNLSIFGDYNINSEQFGGNQCHLKNSYNNEYVDNTLSSFFPNSTSEEKVALLQKATDKGCGYTAVTNLIFKSFEGNEKEFYDTFGFPMYEIKCNKTKLDEEPTFSVDYNYEPIIMDLFCTTNSEPGISDIKSTIVNGSGTSPDDLIQMNNYLNSKYGLNLNLNQKNAEFVADIGYSLYTMDGDLHTEDGGAHAMTCTGHTEDGKLIVSTWGTKLIYEPSSNEDYQEWFEPVLKGGENNE